MKPDCLTPLAMMSFALSWIAAISAALRSSAFRLCPATAVERVPLSSDGWSSRSHACRRPVDICLPYEWRARCPATAIFATSIVIHFTLSAVASASASPRAVRLMLVSSFVAISVLPRATSATVTDVVALQSRCSTERRGRDLLHLAAHEAFASATLGPKLERPSAICGGVVTWLAQARSSFISDSGLSDWPTSPATTAAAAAGRCGVGRRTALSANVR